METITIEYHPDLIIEVDGYYDKGEKEVISSVENSYQGIAPSFDIQEYRFIKGDNIDLLYQINNRNIKNELEEKCLEQIENDRD